MQERTAPSPSQYFFATTPDAVDAARARLAASHFSA